jgi:hypothetical protein
MEHPKVTAWTEPYGEFRHGDATIYSLHSITLPIFRILTTRATNV